MNTWLSESPLAHVCSAAVDLCEGLFKTSNGKLCLGDNFAVMSNNQMDEYAIP